VSVVGIIDGTFRVMGAAAKATYTLSMASGNAIYTSLQKARTKKEIREIHKTAADANYQNRSVMVMPSANKQQLLLTTSDPADNDVYDYDSKSPTPAMDYIWGESNNPEGILVSGGENSERVKALIPFVHKSQQENIPVFVLHCGNDELLDMLQKHCVDSEFVSRRKTYYDVFRGMPADDIVYLLYETMPDDDANPKSEAFIRALVETVMDKMGTATIHGLASFPITRLKDELNDLRDDDQISTREYKDIERYYMAGSSEMDSVRIYLNKLNRQAESIYGKDVSQKCNIKRMLNRKGVIAIDVGRTGNDLLVELVINHLLMLQSQGRDFSILIDELPISKHPKLRDLLKGRTYAICQKDLISSLYGGEKQGDELFSELAGDVKAVVLFKHYSGTSCQKWSDFMGKYKKIRIRYSIAQNSAFMNSSNSKGVSVDETDEPRIRAETLSKLPKSMACIYSSNGILLAEL